MNELGQKIIDGLEQFTNDLERANLASEPVFRYLKLNGYRITSLKKVGSGYLSVSENNSLAAITKDGKICHPLRYTDGKIEWEPSSLPDFLKLAARKEFDAAAKIGCKYINDIRG